VLVGAPSKSLRKVEGMAKQPESPDSDDDKEFSAIQIAFGKRVRDARKRAGLTQGQLALGVGLAQSYVHAIETQGSNISLKALAKLATALRVSMRDLIPDNEFDEVSPTSIAQLIHSLDTASAVLRSIGLQHSELKVELDKTCKRLSEFDALKAQLARTLKMDEER